MSCTRMPAAISPIDALRDMNPPESSDELSPLLVFDVEGAPAAARAVGVAVSAPMPVDGCDGSRATPGPPAPPAPPPVDDTEPHNGLAAVKLLLAA